MTYWLSTIEVWRPIWGLRRNSWRKLWRKIDRKFMGSKLSLAFDIKCTCSSQQSQQTLLTVCKYLVAGVTIYQISKRVLHSSSFQPSIVSRELLCLGFVRRLLDLTEAIAVTLKSWLLQVPLLAELTEGLEIRTTICPCGLYHVEEDVFHYLTLDLPARQESALPASVTDIFKRKWSKQAVLAKYSCFCPGHAKRKRSTVQVRAFDPRLHLQILCEPLLEALG